MQWIQRFAIEVNDTLKRDFYSHQYNALSEKITLILSQLQEMLEQYAFRTITWLIFSSPHLIRAAIMKIILNSYFLKERIVF